MKVILLQDVARLGRRFEVKEVPTGHALNFLIPQKKAEPATKENIKRVKARASHKAAEIEAVGESFESALAALAGKRIELRTTANEQGHLFKGLHADDIVESLKAEGVTVTANQIVLTEPIKEVGEHEIMLSSGEKKGVVTITVLAE